MREESICIEIKTENQLNKKENTIRIAIKRKHWNRLMKLMKLAFFFFPTKIL